MTFCTNIRSDDVLECAIGLIQGARTSIIVTMDVDEELLSPLSGTYRDLITKQYQNGLIVMRYGFGSNQSFTTLATRTKIPFVYAGRFGYQRMLIVDRERGLFRLGNTVYRTEYEPLASSLVKYAESVYNRHVGSAKESI